MKNVSASQKSELLPFAALTLWLDWNNKVKQQTTAAPPLMSNYRYNY